MNIIIQSSSLKGLRPQNEDELHYINNLSNNNKDYKNYLCAGVFDGHGGGGVSSLLVKKINIFKYFIDKLTKDISNKKDYNKFIIKVYDTIQKSLINNEIKANKMGSTALISVIYPYNDNYRLKIINLGDCRAVICNKNNIGIALTIDHKPNQWIEKYRITNLGGIIEYSLRDDPRISGLSVSRSFGDLDCKFISQEPDIFDYIINNDKFMIMACDGLWDVMSNQEAIDYVIECLLRENKVKIDKKMEIEGYNSLENKEHTTKTNNIAYQLAKYALDKGSQDNLLIIILFFQYN